MSIPHRVPSAAVLALVLAPAPAGSGGTPVLTRIWQVSGGASSVAVLGDVDGDGLAEIALGAPLQSFGRVRVYAGTPSGPGGVLATRLGTQAGSDFGRAIVGADLDGDGHAELVVGSPYHDVGPTQDAGRVVVYGGGPAGLSAAPVQEFLGSSAGGKLGTSLAAGDWNGDGFDDLAVGESGYHGAFVDQGRVLVFLGGPGGTGTTPDQVLVGDGDGAFLGTRVACAGDVDGDGIDDLLAAEPFLSVDQANEGRVRLHLGSPAGPLSTAAWAVEGDQDLAILGLGLAGGADVNGDGFDDVFVGTSGWNGPDVDSGIATLYLGSAAGLAPSPAWTYEGAAFDEQLGHAGALGDVNGDGFADLFVGAPGLANWHGRGLLFLGGPAGLETQPAWTETSPVQAYFARTLSAGDVDGDGTDEVLVGAPIANEAYLYAGTPRPGAPTCFGDASGTGCPCGNDAAEPTGCLHSGAVGMVLEGSGTASIGADDLVLVARDCPIGNSGIFYCGKTALAPPAPLYDGLQCAGGDVRRFQGVFQATGAASDTGFVAQDPSGTYFQPGVACTFQFWSRDVAAGPTPCGTFANLSSGYAVLWRP